MLQQPYMNPRVIYEANPVHVETVKTLRVTLHDVCKNKLMHKYVRVQTIDGHEYEGVIVHVDGGHIYLSLARDEQEARFFPFGAPFSPFVPSSAILPLVLYDLLVITLLVT